MEVKEFISIIDEFLTTFKTPIKKLEVLYTLKSKLVETSLIIDDENSVKQLLNNNPGLSDLFDVRKDKNQFLEYTDPFIKALENKIEYWERMEKLKLTTHSVLTENKNFERGKLTDRILELVKELKLERRDPKFALKARKISRIVIKEGFGTNYESVRKRLNALDYYSDKRRLK